MTPETSNPPFVFGYNEILELAREYDQFGKTMGNRSLTLTVGLTGYEIWQFAQRLKRELIGEETHRRRATDVTPEVKSDKKRIQELEMENNALRAKLLTVGHSEEEISS